MTANLKKIGDEFKNTTSELSAAKQEIKDFAAIAQGEVVNAANAQVHELHIQTLQKITDEMSDAARKVLDADEAIAVAKINQETALKMTNEKLEEQRKVIENAT